MKTRNWFLSFSLTSLVAFFLLAFTVSALEIGDSYEQVVEELGKPSGQANLGNQEKLMKYPRGMVRLVDGKVVEMDLIPEEEWKAKQEAEKVAATRQAEADRVRIKKGLELAERVFQSPEYRMAAATRQLNFLAYFRKTYPEIDVNNEYQTAMAARRLEIQEEEALRARERQQQELLDRVARAERENARLREEQNQRVASHHRRSVYDYGYRYPYYNVPVVPYYPYGPVRPVVEKKLVEKKSSTSRRPLSGTPPGNSIPHGVRNY